MATVNTVYRLTFTHDSSQKPPDPETIGEFIVESIVRNSDVLEPCNATIVVDDITPDEERHHA